MPTRAPHAEFKPRTSLVGMIVGRLKVTRFLKVLRFPATEGKRKQQYNVWECLCECGNTKEVIEGNLRRGGTKSCGCYQKERAQKLGQKFGVLGKLPPGLAALNMLYGQYRHEALERNLVFMITQEQFKDLVVQNCYYCGEPPRSRISKRKGLFIYNGVDRVDNLQGYLTTNCVTSCRRCNLAKNQHTLQEFRDWVFAIARRFNEGIIG